jgi:hypothetical protein
MSHAFAFNIIGLWFDCSADRNPGPQPYKAVGTALPPPTPLSQVNGPEIVIRTGILTGRSVAYGG